MSIFKKLAKKLSGEPTEEELNAPVFSGEESKTEEIKSQRSKVKESIMQNLQRIGFTEKEINEVIEIINISEYRIQQIIDELIGTNINNDAPMEILNDKLKKIRNFELKAAEDIRNKVSEIIKRKQSQQ